MRCTTARRHLDAYASNEMAAPTRARVDRHLARCEQCRQALARLGRLAALLQGVATPPVPEGFSARLLSEARRRLDAGQPTTSASWDPFHWWVSASLAMRLAATAALAAGLAIGALMGRGAWRQSAAKPAARAARAGLRAVYTLDSLAEVPEDSLARVYLQGPWSQEGREGEP